MGLHENLLRGIYAFGLEKPSVTQQRGIVPLCKGLDVIQQAQSGIGKTATFCSGVLQQVDHGVVECQALVLAPSRELAQRIETVMQALGDYLGVRVHACGQTNLRKDQHFLSRGFHVVWIKCIQEILRRFLISTCCSPPKIHVGVFSATIPLEAHEITRKFMNKPVRIHELRLEGIKQFYTIVDKEEQKLDIFCNFFENLAVAQCVIFVNTKHNLDWLTDELCSRENAVTINFVAKDDVTMLFNIQKFYDVVEALPANADEVESFLW
ncbi:Eukaryotic initiation factor 4A-2 [Heracleum sosnowskyi]|uniref:ATP-dependent RNA helicase n=1 Tax=Heracleum sosnowskyi TaxID=360622 RepID=A0AAD8GSN1_9APIA|nr:Eukaryotic initiation factor 4A-2 [Heracleum sosnowskyi]